MNCVLFAKMDQIFSLKNKTLKKILEKWKKMLEKSGNFVSPEKWEPCQPAVLEWQSTKSNHWGDSLMAHLIIGGSLELA